MKKKLIRLTESDLHRIIRNSVNRVIKESKFYNNKRRIREAYANGIYDYDYDDDESKDDRMFNDGDDEFCREVDRRARDYYETEDSTYDDDELGEIFMNEIKNPKSDGVIEGEIDRYFSIEHKSSKDTIRLINVIASKLQVSYEDVSNNFGYLMDLYNNNF